MYLLIGADFVPTSSNCDLFESGDIDALFGDELKRCLMEASYRIFNLEVPLADVSDPIPKCGPNLIAPTKTIAAYKAIGVDLLTLANNHILDQNIQGMKSTCEILEKNRIHYSGVGQTLNEAVKPFSFEFSGKKIGVYTCCEHEFSIAGENHAGVNPFDPLESPDHVQKLKENCDYVIVLYHGGKEHYRYPSPMLQKTCRKLVEKGADLVVCQHSHCVGCEEKYLDGTIVYGQGNFLFDHSSNECWNTGMLISLNERMKVSYVPLVRFKNRVRLADEEEACSILSEFQQRSREILQSGFVERKYDEFAKSMIENYLWAFSGINRTFLHKVLDKLTRRWLTTWMLKKRYSQNKRLRLQNYIECEAHRELVLRGVTGNSAMNNSIE